MAEKELRNWKKKKVNETLKEMVWASIPRY